MQILLEELYKADIHLEKYYDRKLFIEKEKSYSISGITHSGKTKLVKNYLLSLKKNDYLYIDCKDVRLEYDLLNSSLKDFCITNKIKTLVLDNYTPEVAIVNVAQLILISQIPLEYEFLETLQLYPLDYEEFLAYEQKYDASLNHFFQLGGLPIMHKIVQENRVLFIQNIVRCSLSDMEFDILQSCAKMLSLKVSAFTLYERLKQVRKISKDKLYRSFDSLLLKNYIHTLEKFNHKKATKKIYLADIAFKSALTTDKHFGRLFENMIFLELLKSGEVCYYDDGVDFYLPQKNEIILGMAFHDERTLFKKLETIEAFIFSYQVTKITAVTMSKESSLSHPIAKVEMVPFDIWTLGDE